MNNVPQDFANLSQAISELSKGFLAGSTDLIQRVRVSDEVILNKLTGNIQVAMEYSDEEAREFSLVFCMRSETSFQLETTYGKVPKQWNMGIINRALFNFVVFLSEWQQVHSVIFCPFMNPRERYTPADLKESVWTNEGWVLNIRGIFNDGEDFIKGLNLFPLEEG